MVNHPNRKRRAPRDDEWSTTVSYSGEFKAKRDEVRRAGGRLVAFEDYTFVGPTGRVMAELVVRAPDAEAAAKKGQIIASVCDLKGGLP